MFDYFSEILLLTKSDHYEELECWLDWHLNILKFDHIVIFDNESPINIKKVISKFSEKQIEYHYIEGWPDQFKLYNNYLKKPKSQWTIALDDDEYLYISDKYEGNIKGLINFLKTKYNKNKYYILWTNFFSENPIDNYNELYINTHTFYSHDVCNNKLSRHWNEDDLWGKTIINNDFSYHYKQEGYSAGHIPKCLNGNDSTNIVTTDNDVKIEHLFQSDAKDRNFDCFIAHYQYKTKKDWMLKCERYIVSTLSYNIKNKVFVYDELYEYKNIFQKCTLLKDKLKQHKEKLLHIG